MVVLPVLLLPAPASAQVEPIRLTYRAYASCPTEGRFVREVTARTERARVATPGEAARAFLVTVTPETGTIRGLLSITSLGGSVSRREVTGDTCSEVVSALALITALAIDPSAATAPNPLGPSPAPAGEEGVIQGAPVVVPPDPALPTTAPAGAVTPAVQRPPAPPPERPADRAPAIVSAPATGSTDRLRWAVGGEGHVLAGLVPALGFGGGGFVDVTGTQHGHLVPSFRVAAFVADARVAFSSVVGATIDWFVARLEACPVRFAWTREWALSACAALDAGVIRSNGSGLTFQVADDQPWFAGAAIGRMSWSPPGDFFVEAGGGVTVQVTRYSFYFERSGVPQAPFQRIPLLGATLDVDAGYRFP
jgi:hypothetical protein